MILDEPRPRIHVAFTLPIGKRLLKPDGRLLPSHNGQPVRNDGELRTLVDRALERQQLAVDASNDCKRRAHGMSPSQSTTSLSISATAA